MNWLAEKWRRLRAARHVHYAEVNLDDVDRFEAARDAALERALKHARSARELLRRA